MLSAWLSGLLVCCGQLGIVSDQGYKGVLLAVGELPKTLQQFAFMQGQLRAIKAQAWLVAKGTFLNQALFESSNNLGVHAAVVVLRNLIDTITHAIRKAYNELVSRAAGISSLFHRAHIFNRLVQGERF